jgi:adenylylsulfate kinase
MINSSKGKVIWLYGRPCSGKSTLSASMAKALKNDGIQVITLDGDALRSGINSDLGFSLADRHENIRRASETAKLLAEQGFWVLCSFVTPTRALRKLIGEINHDLALIMIYIHASLEVCKKRDVKGHYFQAETRQLSDFTGISSPFEEPESYVDTIDTEALDIQQATKKCMDLILNERDV